MPNRKAKDRKRFKRKLNDSLNKYGRTRKQIQSRLKKANDKTVSLRVANFVSKKTS